MGILDELNKQLKQAAQGKVVNLPYTDTRPREEVWAEQQQKWQEGERNLANRENVRRLNTEPEQKPQPTQQMTALTAAINKWASKGTVVKDMPARRKLMFEPQPEKNWYSGEVPTNSEILARIASISESDPAQSKELFNQYQAFANDPTSPLYNPYKTSTNKAITELQNLGFDMSGGVTDKWLQDNAWLMQYYRTETGNTPLAPTKKSSPQENAAYWYYKVLTAEETTQKAETEWQALQDEITYWANRSDRNYSDDEILAKIDWSNYKTLTGMDDGAAKGVPTTLNRAVGYSTDALKGVIWAARNGSTGDFTMDSVNAVLGKGKGWTKNNTITQKLDPTSSKYSPYSVGSTLDEAAIYFGVQEFGKNWLDNNRALINSSDATERKMYAKVYNAEQTTQKAEAELADLQKYVNSLIREGADPAKVADAIALYVDDSCPTLAKMDESLKSGDLMGTTRAVGYKLEDIQADARKRVDAANGKVGGGQYVQNLAKKFGANIKAMATDTQVQKWRDAFVQGAYDTIQKLGTDEEKISFGNGGSADYGNFLRQLVEVIGSEAPNGQEIVDDALAGADAFAKENYLDAYGVVHQYEEAQQALEDIQKELDELLGSPSAQFPGLTIASAGSEAPLGGENMRKAATPSETYENWLRANMASDAVQDIWNDDSLSEEEMDQKTRELWAQQTGGNENVDVYDDYTLSAVPENGAPRAANPEDQARVNLLYAQQQEQQARLEALQAQYDEKAAILKEAQENYEAAQRYAQTYGIDISNVGTLMQDFEIAWQLGSEYVPTEWTAYTLYGQAQKDNVAHATISEAATKNRAECMEAIAQIDSLLIRLGVNADSDGTEHEQLIPDDFVDNITRYKESLEREMNAATYWLMQDAEGFEDTANQAREEINKQYNSSFIVGPDLKLMYQIANPDWEPDSVEDINTYVDQMTDDERNTYLYLWKSAGADAAREYYDYLTDDSYGVLTTRTNQAMQNAYTKMTQSGWLAGLGMNVMDVLASPMRLYGTAYTAIAGLQGKEINPNSKWFAASTMDTAVTSATTQSITDAFGEGTTLTWLAKLAYESGKSIAESMYTGHLFGGITGGGSGMFSDWLGAVPMGAEAVASAVQDAKLNGATNEQALAIGGITFFAETVSEAITIGNLKEALHKGGSEGLKASFKSILKNAFTEEAPGEMFNEAIESAADYWIMGDNSKYNQEVQRLMIEEGLTKDQAEDRALVGIVGDVLYAGLSGAVGGIMGGAPEAIAGKYAYNSAVRAIQKQTGLDFDSASKILDAMETARGAQQTSETTGAQEEKPVAPTDTGKSRQETFDEGAVAEQAPQEITEEPVTPSETPAETSSEITEEPVTEAQPETASGSTLAPVDTSRFGQVGGSNSRAANAAAALTASFGADTASRTETIGAALAPEDGQNIAPARTAAQHLAAKLGSNKAVGVMRGIVHATMDGNMNYETVQVAVTTAILNEGGQANVMLTNMAENGVTVENLNELVNEATTEAADPEVQAEMESTIRENEIAEHVKALVADGALNGLEPMKQSVTDAKNKRRAAKTALTKQVNKFNAAKQAFQEAQTAFRADPTNKDLKAAKNAKRAEMKAQSAVVDEYRQRLQNAEETVKGAEETLQNAETQAMNNLRQQAQEQIAQEQAQAQAEAEQQAQEQAQAEAEAQAQAEQQAQQEAEAQAQEDIETGKAEEDATDAVVDQAAQNAGLDAEQTERLRERAQERLEKAKARKTDMKQAVTSADAKNILGRLSRKLGVEIKVGDTGIARGKYANGVITVSDKLTIGQAVVEAALHEVTHAIEQTGAYSAYRDVVFKTLYASDDAIEAAVARKIAEYGKHGVTLDDEGARREIVADFARTKLNNKETVDRLVDSGFGATIRNALHRINQRIRNLSLSGEERTMADNLLEAERLFNKAIKERQKMETHPSAEQFSIPQLAQAMGMTFDENTLEIKDPNTGKVIKQVTPEMMTNTPIGKLIDLAEKGYTVGKMHFAPTIDAETAAQQRKMFADLMTLCTKYKDSNLVWEIASSTLSSPFSALKKNSDKQYGTTIDFSTVCTKTQAIIDALSKTMVEKGRGLTRDEVMKAYNKTFDAGLKVPCPVCYVFARWMGVPSLLGQMSRYQDEFFIKNADGSMDVAATQAKVDAYLANAMSQFSSPKELNKYLGKIKGQQSKAEERRTNLMTDLEKIKRGEMTEKKPGETQKKIDALDKAMVERDERIGELEAYNWVTQVLCNQDENGNYVVDESFVPVAKEVLFDLNRTAEFAKNEKSWRYRNTRGAGMGKAILPYTGESLGDIINGAYRLAEDQNPFLLMDAESAAKAMQKAYEKARAQNLIGGQRLQSTSDFRPEWGLDYMMSFLEMQAIGSHAQMYTKVAEAVDLLASVGIDVNLSIMGKGKGWHVDENGNKVLDFSDVTGMNYETARAYKDKYDNVQMILVGMNDDHIRLAIANTDIDFVIPWHSSGNSRQTLGRLLNGVGENLEASTDYSSTQNDKASKNQTAAQKERFDIRKKILTGEELTDAEFDIVQQDSAWLLPLWRRFNVEGVDPDCYGVKLSSSQASQIFPFEYWVTDPSQPGGTKDTADVNGQRFVDYCASFGMIPRFSQFKNDPGYWKLLIDRSMYDRQGNYRKQQTVDVTKAQIGNLNEQGDLVNSQLPGYIPMTMSGDADYDRRVQQAVDNTLAMLDEQYDAQGDINITDDAQLSVDGDITDADIDQMLADAGIVDVNRGVATATQEYNNDVQALRGDRTVPEAPGTVPQGTPKISPYRSAINLADAIGVGHIVGTSKMQNQGSKALHKPIPKQVLGYFQRRAEYIRVRSNEAGNYLTTMHELWHALGKRLGMDGTAEMVANLDPAFASSYDASELPGEAFAEFGWNYVMGDAQARAFAGDAFVDAFERAAKNAGLYDAIKQAQKEMQIWLNADVTARERAVVHDADEANKAPKGIRHLLDSVVDDTSVADEVDSFTREQTGEKDLSVDQSLRKMSLLKNYSQRVASSLLTNKLTNSYGIEIGDSLSKRLEDAGVTGKDFDTLVQYWLFKHSMDRDMHGKPVFDATSFTPEARQAFINDIEANHKNIVKGEQALQSFRKEFLKAWLVDTGFLRDEDLMAMESLYPHYAPTMRIMDQNGGGFRGNRKGYTIRRATGGTQDIINPMDSYVSMIQSVVNMVRANKAAVLFDDLFLANEGMGVFAEDVTEDMRKETVNTEALQDRVARIIYGKADTALTAEQDDVLQRVLDAIGTEQEQWKGTGKVNGSNILTVTRYGGEKVYYKISNPELYNLLASQRDNVASPLLQKVAKLTRAMSALTTGSNPVFAIRNFMRDYQNSVNYGSWASNYLTGFPKWIKAAYDVWTKGGEYKDYVALGGGGWNRIDTGTKQGITDYRGDLFKGYNTKDAAGVAKTAAQGLWKLVTFEKVNEVVEQASRYAEYKYGKHDKSDWAGMNDAFLASQDVTVDFARTGNGRLAADLKAIIPFFGASMQGVYRTARMFTEAERDRAPARFTKTIVNTALTSALCSALLLKFTPGDDDDEKKDFLKRFTMMSGDLKAGHFYLPNFAPSVFGQAPLIRIPVAQDPLSYAVHGMVTDLIWKGSQDVFVTDVKAIANTILDNLTPINSTILDPLISLQTNKNWYGGSIVPSRMSDWDPTTQYTAETPSLFVNMGRAFGVSPMKLQYMAEQYTGFLGQMAIPAMSYDKNTGEIGGLMAAVNAARKRLTSDPLVSNDITSSFYDGANIMEQLKKAATNEMPTNMLRRGLSDEEISRALAEAQAMTTKGGIVYDTKQLIKDTYSRIDKINANESLSDEEKYTLTSQARKDMLDAVLDAQEQIGAWKENYVTGRNFVTDALYPGGITHNPTAYEKMPDTFKADENEEYMQLATEVYERTGKDSALPHPSNTFKYTPKGGTQTDVTVDDAYWPDFCDQYKTAYVNKLNELIYKSSKDWGDMTDEEQLSILTKAHDNGREKAKAWYLDHGPKN